MIWRRFHVWNHLSSLSLQHEANHDACQAQINLNPLANATQSSEFHEQLHCASQLALCRCFARATAIWVWLPTAWWYRQFCFSRPCFPRCIHRRSSRHSREAQTCIYWAWLHCPLITFWRKTSPWSNVRKHLNGQMWCLRLVQKHWRRKTSALQFTFLERLPKVAANRWSVSLNVSATKALQKIFDSQAM